VDPNQRLALAETGRRVTVTAPARLHMGFVDLSGDLGRRFGGLGLTLAGIHTRLSVWKSPSLSSAGPSSARAGNNAQTLLEGLGLHEGVHIEVMEAIPEHIGLGSGTQMALAVSSAIAHLFNLETDLRTLAGLMRRGVRSGIGLGTFEHGGFVVDGGRGDKTTVPPVLCHLSFPGSWRLFLIFDGTVQGLSGTPEVTAFKDLPPMEPALSAHLSRLVLMQVLPSLAEMDFARFSQGVTAIQDIMGDYFARFQGGRRYTSPLVAEALDWLKTSENVSGVGQSSWGPTGFAVIESDAQAQRLLSKARERWCGTLNFLVCKAWNKGAEIRVEEGIAGRDLLARHA
jgi:beta-RFAP synthase